MRALICWLLGHRDLRTVSHWEVCEYNYVGTAAAHGHGKGGAVGEKIDRFCAWCDSGWLDRGDD